MASLKLLLVHPTGYDARLVSRVEGHMNGADVHDFNRLRETYFAHCMAGQLDRAAECETELRAMIPVTHKFIGKTLPCRAGQFCRLLHSSHQQRVIQFRDEFSIVCRPDELEAIGFDPRPERCCISCGDAGKHISLVRGECVNCRGEL
jgi:hypothetical protein